MSVRRIFPVSEEDWRIEPVPSWVDYWEPDWEFEAPAGSAFALLLVDEQQHVPSHSVSNRIVRRLLTSEAVQAFAQVEIPFDARTHRLHIHDLVVWSTDPTGARQGSSVVDSVQFEVRAPDRQADRGGVVARLERLREGDAVDLSWTLVPVAPLPNVPFTTFHGFVWNVPCGVTHFTIHSDPSTPFRSQLHCPPGVAKPEPDAGPGREHWRQWRPPITRFEPNAPPGVWNFPVLEISGWRDWKEVAEATHALWAEPLAEVSPDVSERVLRLQSGRNQVASISDAIRFVQDEIADLVPGFGRTEGLFANDAGTVLRQRGGDAKDKAVLLTVLLRELGVDACPLLANPDWQETLATLLPSPDVFNHFIVTFVANGKRHFVDPSDASQKGNFAQWIPPAYGFGLEVRPGVKALTALPSPPQAELVLTETFHLDAEEGGFIEQDLRATHWLAEEMRESILRDGRASFIQAHLEALKHQFPALSHDARSAEVRDDPDANFVAMRGRYGLPAWNSPDASPPAEFRYRANGLFLAVDWIEQPEARTVARALRHPMRVQHVVQVQAKFIRPAKAERRDLTGPGFRYRCDVSWKQGMATFDHVWESTASRVEAAEWPDYCRALRQVFELVESAVPATPARTSPFWAQPAVRFSVLAAGILAILGTIASFTGLVPWQQQGPPQAAESVPLKPPPPPEVQAQVQMAVDAAIRGDLTSAAPVLEKEQEHFKEDAAFQFIQAEVAVRTGQLDRARQSLERAKALDPTNVKGEVLTALINRTEGNESGAKQILASAVERNPNDPRPLRELAITLAQQGDLKGACEAWARVLELTPDDADALRRYAVVLWQNGEKERADALITNALGAQSPPSAALEAAAGDYYTFTGRRAEALNRLEKASSLAPGDRSRDFALASGQIRMGRTQEAVELATKLTQEFPTDVRGWQALAVAKSILGDQPGADAAYQEWLRLAPHDPDGPANFGSFLHQTGRNEQARDLLAKCTAQFPKQGVIWLNYSVVLEALGEKEPAAAARLKANELLTDEEKQLLIR